MPLQLSLPMSLPATLSRAGITGGALLWLAGAALLLALFWQLTLWRARRREARALRDFPPEGRILDVDGTPVHVVVEGAGPDVVLIHGSSGNTRDMTFSLSRRLARDFRVLTFDRPGLGHTPEPAADGSSLADQARLMARACALLNAPRPVVMGQSLGGAVALAWAVHCPQALSALVLVSAPAHRWPGGLGLYYGLLAHPRLGPLVATLIAAWVPMRHVERVVASVFAPQQAPPGYPQAIGAALTLRRASLLANARHRRDLKDEVTALSRHYRDLDLPVEILHGTADTTVFLPLHSAPLAREVSGARLTRLDGIGHMPHHVREDAVVAAIHRAAGRAAAQDRLNAARPAPIVTEKE